MNLNTAAATDRFFMIKTADKKTTAKGMPYLDLMLCDKSGEISAKLWDYKEELQGMFSVGDIVKVRGTVSPYNGVDQMRVEKCGRLFLRTGSIRPNLCRVPIWTVRRCLRNLWE